MSDLSTLSPSARHLAGRYRRASLAMPAVAVALAAVELVTLALVQWFALYAATPADAFAPLPAGLEATALAALGVASITLAGGYERVAAKRARRGMATTAAAALGPAALAALAAPMGADPARLIVAALVGVAAAAMPLRAAAAGLVAWADESGLMERRAVLVGGGAGARRVIEGLDAHGGGIRVCAIFDDRAGERSPDLVLDVPRIGRFDDLMAFASAAEIDLVIVTLDVTATDRIAQVMERFAALPVPVHLSAFSDGLAFRSERLGGLIPLREGTFGAETRLRKRAFDLAFGAAALVLAAPLMLAAAVAIKLDGPGPVLFRQWRAGLAGRPVEVLKFRTLRHDAADPEARRVVTRDDDRVTAVGRVLRRTSIDELPQLINVLRGDLSLVGPRPHALDARSAAREAFEVLVEGYGRRHRLPPGITGWAQVNGWRGTVEDAAHLRARVDHDLWYIENWSPMLDLRILLATPASLLRVQNAF